MSKTGDYTDTTAGRQAELEDELNNMYGDTELENEAAQRYSLGYHTLEPVEPTDEELQGDYVTPTLPKEDLVETVSPKYTPEELEKSKRIFKSATPKYTPDWYIKWVASIFVLGAMSIRGVEGLQMYDLGLSVVGISLWLTVSILWNDRALIVLNSVGLLFLLRNFITGVVGI